MQVQVAILGCGQLARMLALAGIPLGLRFSFLAQAAEDSSAVDGLGTVFRLAGGESYEELYQGLGRPQVVTVEREQFPISVVRGLAEYCLVHPNPEAIYRCRHRLRQKRLLQELNVPHTPFKVIHSAEALTEAASEFGWPLVIKNTEDGYDGKAQWRLQAEGDIEQWIKQVKPFDDAEERWIAEPMMAFDAEISFIAARNRSGALHVYPPTENQHINGVLVHSLAPARQASQVVINEAAEVMKRLMNHLDYAGVMAMECFVAGEQWWVNELAPRVHNSGHWTEEGTSTSQFENHLRGIAGWSLGNPNMMGAVGMLNLLGVPLDQPSLLNEEASLNWYNKSVRPGRKVGHMVLRDITPQGAWKRLTQLHDRIYGNA